MKASDRIIFALDVPDAASALSYVEKLCDHVGMFKVGLELFIAEGPKLLDKIAKSRGPLHAAVPIMLDLKLHDIPETVERAVVRIGAEISVKFFTLHVQQRETLSRVAALADSLQIQPLGVTVLTSMTEHDCGDLYQPSDEYFTASDPSTRARLLAKFAADQGLRGFVCSPKEVKTLRKALPAGTVLVVPGIRPAGSDAGDQKRTGTPKQAIEDGADHIVVGRPIRDAPDPVEAAKAIAAEIEA